MMQHEYPAPHVPERHRLFAAFACLAAFQVADHDGSVHDVCIHQHAAALKHMMLGQCPMRQGLDAIYILEL